MVGPKGFVWPVEGGVLGFGGQASSSTVCPGQRGDNESSSDEDDDSVKTEKEEPTDSEDDSFVTDTDPYLFCPEVPGLVEISDEEESAAPQTTAAAMEKPLSRRAAIESFRASIDSLGRPNLELKTEVADSGIDGEPARVEDLCAGSAALQAEPEARTSRASLPSAQVQLLSCGSTQIFPLQRRRLGQKTRPMCVPRTPPLFNSVAKADAKRALPVTPPLPAKVLEAEKLDALCEETRDKIGLEETSAYENYDETLTDLEALHYVTLAEASLELSDGGMIVHGTAAEEKRVKEEPEKNASGRHCGRTLPKAASARGRGRSKMTAVSGDTEEGGKDKYKHGARGIEKCSQSGSGFLARVRINRYIGTFKSQEHAARAMKPIQQKFDKLMSHITKFRETTKNKRSVKRQKKVSNWKKRQQEKEPKSMQRGDALSEERGSSQQKPQGRQMKRQRLHEKTSDTNQKSQAPSEKALCGEDKGNPLGCQGNRREVEEAGHRKQKRRGPLDHVPSCQQKCHAPMGRASSRGHAKREELPEERLVRQRKRKEHLKETPSREKPRREQMDNGPLEDRRSRHQKGRELPTNERTLEEAPSCEQKRQR
eukprot:TRINITY_DN13046_c0_g1_i3.p1 TRINITY_DN13046_c0_g1~~TRINITY_DN13046_c0_g1_i3.p1  ORF type:complete len:621 (+),score=133.41 TRINITY_DN13046_c0_g1_i3:75-1865(+)